MLPRIQVFNGLIETIWQGKAEWGFPQGLEIEKFLTVPLNDSVVMGGKTVRFNRAGGLVHALKMIMGLLKSLDHRSPPLCHIWVELLASDWNEQDRTLFAWILTRKLVHHLQRQEIHVSHFASPKKRYI